MAPNSSQRTSQDNLSALLVRLYCWRMQKWPLSYVEGSHFLSYFMLAAFIKEQLQAHTVLSHVMHTFSTARLIEEGTGKFQRQTEPQQTKRWGCVLSYAITWRHTDMLFTRQTDCIIFIFKRGFKQISHLLMQSVSPCNLKAIKTGQPTEFINNFWKAI